MLRFVLDYIKQNRKIYAVGVAALIIYDLTLLLPTKVIQGLIDHLVAGSLTMDGLVQQALFLLAVALVNYTTSFIWYRHIFYSSINFQFDLQMKNMRKLLQMRTPFYEKFSSGDLLTRFSTDIDSVGDMLGYGLLCAVQAGGMLLFFLPAMFFLDWKVSLVALLPLLLMGVCYFMLSNKQDRFIEDNREAIAALNTEILETVDGIRVARAYGKKDQQVAHFASKTKTLRQIADRNSALSSAYSPLILLCQVLSQVLILWVGMEGMQKGQLSLGQLIALQLYANSLNEPFQMVSELVLIYKTGRLSLQKLEELLETSDELEADGTAVLEDLESVVFRDYHFTYPQASLPSLSGINWVLKAGQTVGIVGKTGAGKTTLIRQLLRQYPCGQGSFQINDQPVVSLQRASIEKTIAYVPQDHLLFSKSIHDNIALGRAGASTEEIQASLTMAAFDRDVAAMKDGLDTLIGEKGVTLSGGQKQRLSLARAFIAQASLLILDDALSAVDAHTEQAILATIQAERAGKTTVIVSHRLSAVLHADWILVLDQGRIVEEGSHEQLLAQKGWYHAQYCLQNGVEGDIV